MINTLYNYILRLLANTPWTIIDRQYCTAIASALAKAKLSLKKEIEKTEKLKAELAKGHEAYASLNDELIRTKDGINYWYKEMEYADNQRDKILTKLTELNKIHENDHETIRKLTIELTKMTAKVHSLQTENDMLRDQGWPKVKRSSPLRWDEE